jgi:hypothetical protein
MTILVSAVATWGTMETTRRRTTCIAGRNLRMAPPGKEYNLLGVHRQVVVYERVDCFQLQRFECNYLRGAHPKIIRRCHPDATQIETITPSLLTGKCDRRGYQETSPYRRQDFHQFDPEQETRRLLRTVTHDIPFHAVLHNLHLEQCLRPPSDTAATAPKLPP